MKEIRTQAHGRALRTFYAFDPCRKAILPIGGAKSGYKLFYDRMISLAYKLMDEHLQQLQKKGEI
jgi:hypothetical protein